MDNREASDLPRRRVHDRSTVAHEVAHAVLGHTEPTVKQERQADLLAASNLIDPAVFWRASKWCVSVAEIADECGVSTKLARAYAESGARLATPSRRAA